MSERTPTRGEIITALVIYRALHGRAAPPPAIDTLATPEQAAQYLAEAERGLAALEAKPELSSDAREMAVERAAIAINAAGWTCADGAHEPNNFSQCVECRIICREVAKQALAAAAESVPAEALTGDVVTASFKDGTPTECGLEDCECPEHDMAPPPAGTYLTIRLDDADAAICLGRATITLEGTK